VSSVVSSVGSGIGRRRVVGAFALEAVGLPVLTICLAAVRVHLAFADDLLLYLAAVIGVTLVGGFVPAIVAAVASSLLLNWYFTPPVHTWTIDSPQNLLALVLFVAVAVAVGSVVHLAARRAVLAAALATQAARAQGLAEGNRIRTTLLAAVGHDLRTPLASVKASVSTLRQTDVTWSSQDQAELLATIEEGADRLNALIGNLLDMSRLTAGSLQPFLRPTAIDEVAPVALRGLDAGGRMQLEVPDDLPLVRTDPGLLERVLANLFANALAYSPPHRDPVLRARPAGDAVLLEIVDYGRGVPDELKTQMFEPFKRLEGRSGPGAGAEPAPAVALATAGGVGLGLAVVRGFLDIMGGSVEAVNTPHGGLTMRVRLPAATDALDPAAAGPGTR
jgi:two-component system, OmpR family, sensor histidine kinase KdpD